MSFSRKEQIRRLKRKAKQRLAEKEKTLTYKHWTDIGKTFEQLIKELEEGFVDDNFWDGIK